MRSGYTDDEIVRNPQSRTEIEHQSDPEGKLKQFGRKARALLQEEKERRPEIKILDLNEANRVSRQKKSSVAVPTSKKPPRPSKRRKVSPQKKISGVPSINSINVSHIPLPSKEFRSGLVKMHGLYSMSTVEDVRRFFTGLKPELVFIVLSNQTYIPIFDVRTDLMASNEEKRDTRIFVKFANSTLASLAAERSGETLKISGERFNKATKTVSIGVTVVDKETARLISNMAIFARPGIPFLHTLTEIEKTLHPTVSTILWKEAAVKLDIALEKRIEQFDLYDNASNPDTLKGYQTLAKHHNRLLELHDELLYQLPSPTVEPFDTYLSDNNTAVRLTTAASKALVKEIDRIASFLHQSRTTAQRRRGTGSDG